MTKFRLVGLISHVQHVGLQHTLGQAAKLSSLNKARIKQLTTPTKPKAQTRTPTQRRR